MAYISNTNGWSFGETLRAAMQQFREARARRKEYLKTLRELRALSDRDLADIGIARSAIGSVAYEHAYRG